MRGLYEDVRDAGIGYARSQRPSAVWDRDVLCAFEAGASWASTHGPGHREAIDHVEIMLRARIRPPLADDRDYRELARLAVELAGISNAPGTGC